MNTPNIRQYISQNKLRITEVNSLEAVKVAEHDAEQGRKAAFGRSRGQKASADKGQLGQWLRAIRNGHLTRREDFA